MFKRARVWTQRLTGMFHKPAHDRDFQQELEANLELQIDDYIRSGMTRDEARRAARIKFGSIESVTEEVRARRGVPFLETLARDVVYGIRQLKQNKGWTAVAILSLALGVGANSALFAVLHNYALEKLPVRNPDELVVLRWYGPNTVESMGSDDSYIARAPGQRAGGDFSFDTFQQLRKSNETLSEIFAFAKMGDMNVFVSGQAEFATGQYVSGNFFGALGGSPPSLGRLLSPADDLEAAAPVAVISYPFWERRFSKDPAAVGRTIAVNGVNFTIAGVSSPDFVDLTGRGTMDAPDISLPLAMEALVRGDGSWLKYPQDWWLNVVGRLKPGVSVQQAEANFAPVFERAARSGWDTFVASMTAEQRTRPDLGARAIRIPRLRVVSANRGVSDRQEVVLREFLVLASIFGIVLCVVCVNVANLSLSRAATREQEIAVRQAIGASRRRLVRQLMTESFLLASIGGTVGMLFAVWAMALLGGIVSRQFSYQLPGPNLTVIAVSGLLTALTGLLFGTVPALRATRSGFSPAIRSGRSGTSRSRLGKSLLVVQVALCLVLLVTAGLFQRTLKNLQRVSPGFNPNNIVLFGVSPSLSGYDRTRAVTLYTQIKETLARTPGVRSVSFAGPESLLADGQTTANVYIEGSDAVQSATIIGIDPDFFATMEIPMKLGRAFTAADTATSPRVAIINETFARKFFAGANPIGKHFAGRPAAPAAGQIEIVGLVADAKVNSLRDEAPPMYYRPMPQFPMPTRMVVVRTEADAASMLPVITDAMRRVDPKLPLRDVSTQVDRIGRGYLLNERIFAYASTGFGSLALFVAMIGLFGLMSYGVARRTKEIGLRMALGAESGVVLKSVMTEALAMVAAGVVIGLGGALLMARMISSLLFGLETYDPLTMSMAAAILFAVSCLAGYLPARRAARVDPMTALRHD